LLRFKATSLRFITKGGLPSSMSLFLLTRQMSIFWTPNMPKLVCILEPTVKLSLIILNKRYKAQKSKTLTKYRQRRSKRLMNEDWNRRISSEEC